jgi:hypothetical protein
MAVRMSPLVSFALGDAWETACCLPFIPSTQVRNSECAEDSSFAFRSRDGRDDFSTVLHYRPNSYRTDRRPKQTESQRVWERRDESDELRFLGVVAAVARCPSRSTPVSRSKPEPLNFPPLGKRMGTNSLPRDSVDHSFVTWPSWMTVPLCHGGKPDRHGPIFNGM